MYNCIMLNSGISVYGWSAPSRRSDADMFFEAAIEVERVFQNESLTDAFKNDVAEDSFFKFFLQFVMISFIFGLWFIGNSIRVIREQCKIEVEEERKEQEQELEISRLCCLLEKSERKQMHEEFTRGRKGKLRCKRRTSMKFRKQNLIKRSVTTLWNKLNQIRPAQVLKTEKIVYHYDELKLSSDENTDITKIQSCATPEISAFVPKFHSSDRYENELNSELCFSSNSSPTLNQPEPLTLEMLKHPKPSHAPVFESCPEPFAPDCLPSVNAFCSTPATQKVTASKVLKESYAIGGDCFNISNDLQTNPKDSGFQDTNGSRQPVSSFQPEEEKMNKILHEVDQHNLIKNVELCGQMQQAQNQMKSEMGDLKSNFLVPPGSVEMSITRSQILDCPLLQTRKKMICHVDKRMKVVRNEIEDTKRKSRKFSTISKKKKDDSLTLLMQSLVWQQRHEERLVRARSKIISSVKSAMETRFRGMAQKHNNGMGPDAKNFCYDCATGRHKLYFIDGVDGCDIEGDDKILREADGFDKDCTVFKLINSWYKELELKRCGSTKERADKMETFLSKVLKEMFLKRYYERGQLISQKYLTVSSTLAQFVFISPKSSIPPSDN